MKEPIFLLSLRTPDVDSTYTEWADRGLTASGLP